MGGAGESAGRSGQVERAAGGCAAALAALIEAHYGSIYRMAWRLIGTREEAQDVAQDVCVKLASSVRSFRGNAEFSTWLYRVSYNTAIDHIRAGSGCGEARCLTSLCCSRVRAAERPKPAWSAAGSGTRCGMRAAARRGDPVAGLQWLAVATWVTRKRLWPGTCTRPETIATRLEAWDET